MSEPVTNAEIEDVLSAVRRLVSENGGAQKAEKGDETRGKLVLTPAFRVDPSSDDQMVADAIKEAHKIPIDEVVDHFVMKAREQSEEAKANATDEPDAAESPRPATPRDPADRAASLASRIAELEAVVNESAQVDYEPAGDEEPEDAPDAVPFRHRAIQVSFDTDEDDVSEVLHTDAEADDADGESLIASEMDTAEVVEAKGVEADIAEVEDAVTPLEDAELAATEPEQAAAPEMPHEDDAEDWVDVAPAVEADEDEAEDFEEIEAASDEAEDDVVDATAFGAGGFEDDATDPEEAFVVDEDMLREIVARLVREELQGTMGTRITRNLRRMVRREIARAMSLQDLD